MVKKGVFTDENIGLSFVITSILWILSKAIWISRRHIESSKFWQYCLNKLPKILQNVDNGITSRWLLLVFPINFEHLVRKEIRSWDQTILEANHKATAQSASKSST